MKKIFGVMGGLVVGGIIALYMCMVMSKAGGWGYVFDTETLTGSTAPQLIDDNVTTTLKALQERLNTDHYFPLTGTQVSDAASGEHRKVTFSLQIADPAPGANKGALYIKDDAVTAKAELFWEDEDAHVLQVTNGGALLAVPAGTILAYGGSAAPTGYMLCDGSAVSRTTYATLFAIIGENFGDGDNVTTFALPDLQGNFVRGWDNGAGHDPDAATRIAADGGSAGDYIGTSQSNQAGPHTHNLQTGTGGGDEYPTPDASSYYGDTVGAEKTTWVLTTGTSETRPNNVAVNYIIKY